jgi:hypothetical protein
MVVAGVGRFYLQLQWTPGHGQSHKWILLSRWHRDDFHAQDTSKRRFENHFTRKMIAIKLNK